MEHGKHMKPGMGSHFKAMAKKLRKKAKGKKRA